MPALLLKCLMGAAAVLLIAVLSKSKNYYVAGLIPLFPTFALIAHYIVGNARGMQDLRTTALFGLCALVPYATYLLAVYYLSVRLALNATLIVATVVWLAAAAILMLLWTTWHPV